MPSTRIRMLKPEFHTSPSTARASLRARLLYQVLWHLANDFGFGETNLLVILGHAFPVSDGVTVEELEGLLREVADCYGAAFYTTGGRYYYWIPTWFDHNRKPNARSRQWIPQPNAPDACVDVRFHPDGPPPPEASRKFRELPASSGPKRGNRETGETGEQTSGQAGGGQAAQPPAGAPFDPESPEPPKVCAEHPVGTADACIACKLARQANEQWRADEAAYWRQHYDDAEVES